MSIELKQKKTHTHTLFKVFGQIQAETMHLVSF